jgi:ADP-heptose:LPS heptosyltransferase
MNWLRKSTNSLILFLTLFSGRQGKITKRILIIKLEVLGDFLIFLPSLFSYREIYGAYQIFLLVDSEPNRRIAERYKKIGLINEIVFINSRKFATNFFYRLKIAWVLRRLNFQKTIYQVYYRRYLGDFLVRSSDAPERIGFTGHEFDRLDKHIFDHYYTKLIPVSAQINTEFERNKYFLKQLGAKTENHQPTFPLEENDLRAADELLKKNGVAGKFAIIFPGAGLVFKQWPTERFAAVCDYLVDQKIQPVICGSKNEIALAEEVIKRQKSSMKASNLAGQTDIFSLAGLLKKSLFYFGNDTGVAHLSVAVQTPAIVIMGGGAFGEFFPYGDLNKNRIIFQKDMPCKNDSWKCVKDPNLPAPCIEAVTVDQAVNEIKDLLVYLKQS